MKESEGGEAPPADLSQWTPGCEQWEGSLLAILWSILSLTRTFYSLLVMWTLSMSAQITGQHFSPRSQWLGSTCKNVLKYYELREACFLWRWVSVCAGVCIECGQLAIDWVKTGIQHSGIDQARDGQLSFWHRRDNSGWVRQMSLCCDQSGINDLLLPV